MSQVTINAAAAELMSSARKVKHTESAAAFPTGFCHVWALVPLGGGQEVKCIRLRVTLRARFRS